MSLLFSSIFLWVDPATLSIFFDSDGGGEFLIFFLLIAGPVYGITVYARYRNKDKRHFHEKETPVQMSNLRGYDNFVKSLKRQNSNKIKGANDARVEGSIVKNQGLKS